MADKKTDPPAVVIPSNVTTDLTNLSAALTIVSADAASVESAQDALETAQASLSAAQAQQVTDQATATATYSQLLEDLSTWESGAMPAQLKSVMGKHMTKLRSTVKTAQATKGTIDLAPWLKFLTDFSAAAETVGPQLVPLIADITAIISTL